jgi:hypothetical protein
MSWPESKTPSADKADGAISHHGNDLRGGTRALFLHRRQPSVKCVRARPSRAGARRDTE